MSIEFYFPTSIYSEKINPLSNEMLPMVKSYLSNPDFLTNHWGYNTTFKVESGLEHLQDFHKFNLLIQEKGKAFLSNLGYNTDYLEFTSQIFTSNMQVGDSHGVHSHPNSLLSGVFYLEVDEKSSPIVFYDPRPFRKFVALPRSNETLASCEKIMMIPENGLLLMWESWLEHEVPINHSANRITLVFNLGKK
jgi:uncharacterized protein (TIGR02466 family)